MPYRHRAKQDCGWFRPELGQSPFVAMAWRRRRPPASVIFGHDYRIRTEADPAGVERLARLVDDTMARIRERTGAVDTLDLAVMAALNLANDLLAAQAREQEQEERRVLADELVALRERIESALAEPVASA